jgi:hypothetical protein
MKPQEAQEAHALSEVVNFKQNEKRLEEGQPGPLVRFLMPLEELQVFRRQSHTMTKECRL